MEARREYSGRHAHRESDGPDYCGQTVYSWDAVANKIVYRYWASDGGVSNGGIEELAPGKLNYPDETYVSLSGASIALRSLWELTEKNKIVAVLEQSTEAGWREIARNRLERVTSSEEDRHIHERIDSCLK